MIALATSKKQNTAKKHARDAEKDDLAKKAAAGDSYAAEKLKRMEARDKQKANKK